MMARQLSVTLPCREDTVETAVDRIAEICSGIDPEAQNAILTAVSEALLNVVRHSRLQPHDMVDIHAVRDTERVEIRIEDDGVPVPRQHIDASAPPPDPLPEGGMGWFLIRSCMHEVNYQREGRNVLTMKRFLNKQSGGDVPWASRLMPS